MEFHCCLNDGHRPSAASKKWLQAGNDAANGEKLLAALNIG
jgi:hypothetical protein